MFFRKQPVLVQIETQVQWLVAKNRQDGHWFGVCPALNLNAAGDNWTEFTECANEATALLFQALFKNGQLEGFLRRHGWQSSPIPAPGTPARFEVPIGIEHRNRVEELVGSVR